MEYRFAVSYGHPKTKKRYEYEYEYQSTATIFYEQMKEITSNI